MTPRLEKLERGEMVKVVDTMDEEEVETLTLVKESLLAELNVEEAEMRRKLLAFGSMVSQECAGGSEEVLEVEDGWEEEEEASGEKVADRDLVETGNSNLHNENYNTTEIWNNNDWIDALEMKNRLLEEEIKDLRESLARVEERKELLKEADEAKVVEKADEGKEDVVESFKELWLDRERLQVVCSGLEGRLSACLTTSSHPFAPPDQALLAGSSTALPTLPLPDLLLVHSFSLHPALASSREELARAMADMRRDRAQYLGLPKQIRPPISLSQVNILIHTTIFEQSKFTQMFYVQYVNLVLRNVSCMIILLNFPQKKLRTWKQCADILLSCYQNHIFGRVTDKSLYCTLRHLTNT